MQAAKCDFTCKGCQGSYCERVVKDSLVIGLYDKRNS